ALYVRDLLGVDLLCAGRGQRVRVAKEPSGRAPAIPRPRLPMDAAGVRRLGRGDRAQHDLGASAALVARARHRGTRSARLPRLAAGPPPAGRRVSGFKFPHPLVLLVAGTALAAAASWVLPAGQYERRDDPVTGRRVVVAGTYHAVPPHPVGPWRALVAIPKGMADAASVIFFVFLIGGAFTVVDRTGALRGAVDWLVRRLARRDALVIPAACLTFALGGVLDNMKEEIIALVPVMLLLVRRLGFDSVTAVAASLGAAAVGAAFSPINPFQVGIAQQLAQLPLLSGSLFRSAALCVVMGVVAGLCGGLGVGGTAAAFVDGFRAMAYAALLIGFARAIYVALDQGRIVDTIVRGLFTPVAGLPLALSALGMLLLHAAVHVAVPSPSGHAVLTLPILVPLSDLLGLSRQVTVLAYQYGGGLCELLTPT